MYIRLSSNHLAAHPIDHQPTERKEATNLETKATTKGKHTTCLI